MKDIITDFIIIKNGGRGATGIHLLIGERRVAFGGSTTLIWGGGVGLSLCVVSYCSREPLQAGRLLSGPLRGSAHYCPLLPEAHS